MKHLLFVFTGLVSLSLFAGSSAFAASATWNGGSGSWATGTNWSTSAAPGAVAGTINNGDTATFNTGTGSVTVDNGRNIKSITFDAGAGVYTLSGGPLVLTSGGTIALGTTGTSFTGSGITESISAPIILEGGYTFANNSTTLSNALSFSGNIINASNGNQTLNLNGATGSGTNTISGSIGNGGGQIALSLGGTVGNNWILSAANTFAGNTTLGNGSTLQIQNNNSLQNSIVSIGSTMVNGLIFSTGTDTVNLAGLLGGGATASETLQDGVGSNGNAVTLQLGLYNNTSGSYNGVLSGTGGITKFGTGTQSFSQSNTYSGTTTLSGFPGDTLSTTLSTNGTPFGTGAITVNGGTLKFVPGTAASTPSFAIASGAANTLFTYAGGTFLNLTKNGASGSVTVNAGGTGSVLNRTNNGVLIIQTSAADLGLGTLGENFAINGTTPVMNGTNHMVSASIVTVGGGSLTNGDFLTYGSNGFASDSTAYNTLATPVTAGTTTSTEIGNVTATTAFSGNNTLYALLVQSGITATLNAGITLTVAGDGTTDGVILNKGTLTGANATSALNFGSTEGVIYSFNGTSTLSVPITGTGGVTFAGNQSFSFGAPGGGGNAEGSTYTGGANVEGVTLTFKTSNDGSDGAVDDLTPFGAPTNIITLNGGTLTGTQTDGMARTVVLGAGGGSFAGGASIALNFSGAGALTLTGANNNNLMDLTGNNTYTGGTYINGTLVGIASENNIGGPTAPIIFGNTGGSGISIIGTALSSLSNPLSFIANNGPYVFDIQSPSNTFTLGQALNFGTGGLQKDGIGTLVLTNAENYTGTTGLDGGILKVDESQGGSLSSFTNLNFAGGTLYILGKSSGTTTQNLGNVTLGLKINGTADTTGGTIVVDSNAANGGVGTTVNLGTLPVTGGAAPGGALQLQMIGANSSITTTSAPDGTFNGTGIYGGRVVYTDSTGATNWATSSSAGPVFTLTGYTSYTTFIGDNGGDSSDNTVINGSQSLAGETTVNSVKLTGSLNLAGNAFTISSGGLLFTGTSPSTISDSVGGGTIFSGLTTATANEIATNNTYSGPASDLIIQDYGTAPLTISASIVNGVNSLGQGELSDLTKAGPGTLILSGVNGYTGTTFLDGGITQISSDSNIGGNNGVITVANSATGSSTVTLASSTLPVGFGVGTTFLGRLVTAISGTTVTLSGNANTALSNQAASYATSQYLVIDGGTLQVTANVTLSESNSAGTAGTATGTINRLVNIGSDGGTINVLNGATLTLPGGVASFTSGQGPSALTIDSNDGSNGVVNIAGTSTMAGGFIINGGTLALSTQQSANNGAFNPVTFGSGTENSIATHPTLTVNNNQNFIAGLDSPTGSSALTENASGTNPNLNIFDGGTDTYTGLVDNNAGGGALAITKGGGGTQFFTNTANTYTGVTTIYDGTLNVASLAAGGSASSMGASGSGAANLVFGGGPVGSAILQYTGSTAQTTNRLFTLGYANNDLFVAGANGAIDASGSVAAATLTFSGTGAIAFSATTTAFAHNLTLTGTNTGTTSTMNTFAPLLSDSTVATSLSKTGTGSWAVTNANTYSGGTSVSGGTLYANSTTGSSTGAGTVAVTSGGTLAGSGIIAPSGTNGISVASGGNVAPGGAQTPVGTFVSYTGVPTNTANGSLSVTTTALTAGSTVLAASPNAQLTFAIGAGAPTGPTTVSQLLVTGGVANIMNFNLNGTTGPGGTSTVIVINDLVGANLMTATSTATEYTLIAGNNTTYEDNGVQLGTGAATGDLGAFNSALGGNQILGGLTLLGPTAANYFSESYPTSELYLVGDNIVLAVPEPSTWALMIGGFGLLVFLQRRKQHQV